MAIFEQENSSGSIWELTTPNIVVSSSSCVKQILVLGMGGHLNAELTMPSV